MSAKVLFLTEAGEGIGYGHLSRSIALADGFSTHECKSTFMVRGEIDSFPLDRDYSVRYTEWFEQETLNKILRNHEIVVVDSYRAPDSLLRLITEIKRNVVFLIDSTQKFHPDGIILFPSVYAGNEKYRQTLASVKKPVLSGLKYLLFSREFWGIEKAEIRPKILTIGISPGSSGIAGKDDLLRLIGRTYGNEISVIIFGENTGESKLKKFPLQYEVSGRLGKEKYVTNLSKLDLLICNGGQTLNEALLMGLPTISMITADNQAENIKEWERIGLTLGVDARKCIDMNIFEQTLIKVSDYDIRRNINEKATGLIDTDGAKRAATEILDITKTT